MQIQKLENGLICLQLSSASFGCWKDWCGCEPSYILNARSGELIFLLLLLINA